MAETVDLTVEDDTMGLYVAEPAGEPKGAIVVLQEAFGVNEHMRSITDRFAEAGYLAVCPHLFHRSGDPELGYEDMTEVIPYIVQLQAPELEADMEASFEYLKGRGFEGTKVGIIGFCMGGSVSFLAANYWALGAAASFYGGGITQGRFGIQTPWIGAYGDLDEGIPTDQVDALAEAARKSGKDVELYRYADANHGFNCDARDSYHEASAKDAWAKTLAFFDEHIG
jgi:carboxymethylenebutenolidase